MAQPVVVGVDGSPAAQEALRLAVEEARLRRAPLRVVHVWHVPVEAYLAGVAPSPEEVSVYAEQARQLLAGAVAQVEGGPDVPIEPASVEGESAATVLVAESARAVLLVVGSRGLHGLRELMLGSVSHACCQRAHCPVLVVPPGAGTEDRLVTTGSTDARE